MDWSRGFAASYRCCIVDRATWGDLREVPIDGGTLNRVPDGLLETADLDTGEAVDGEWLRVYLDAVQDGEHVRVPLFTGIASSKSRTVGAVRDAFVAECSSVLQAASDVLLPRGWYAPAGYPAAKMAAKLLGVFGVRCGYADGSPTLSEAIVAEDGETNMTMAWKLADAVGWRISVDGSGTVSVGPRKNDAKARFLAGAYDVLESGATDEDGRLSGPNVLRVTSGGATAVARDDDPRSPLSTVSRGREVWAAENDPDMGGSASLSAYASRRLKELQGSARKLKYDRRFHPDVRPGDHVELGYGGRGLDGTFRVDSQRIEIGAGCKVSEEATEC